MTIHKKIVWIHVNFTQSRLRPSLLEISDLLSKKHLFDIKKTIYIVDNSSEDRLCEIDIGINTIYLNGSNKFWEFSGWQEGLDYELNGLHDSQCLYIFSNDTMLFHQPYFYLKYFIMRGIKRALVSDCSEPLAMGFVENCKSVASVGSYMTTFFFIINACALNRIDNKVYDQQTVADCFNEISNSGVLFCNLPPDYINFLENWLLKDKVSNNKWRGAEVLNTKNWIAIQGKAKSILFEHDLSVRLRSNSISISSLFGMGVISKVTRAIYHRI